MATGSKETLWPNGGVDQHPKLPPTYDLQYYGKLVNDHTPPRRRRFNRTRQWIEQHTERVEAAFHTSLTMAEMMIRLSLRGETDAALRAERERKLIERWKRFHARVSGAAQTTRNLARFRP
jgi:hypothetical protein